MAARPWPRYDARSDTRAPRGRATALGLRGGHSASVAPVAGSAPLLRRAEFAGPWPARRVGGRPRYALRSVGGPAPGRLDLGDGKHVPGYRNRPGERDRGG